MKSKFVHCFLGVATVVIVGCQTTPETSTESSATAAPTAPVSSAPSGPIVRMTPERAHLLGREISEILVAKEKLLDSDKVSLFVNRVGQYVAAHLDTGPKNMKCVGGGEKVMPVNGFRFAVVHSSEKETIAMPGGFIFITDALLADLKSEDQLAGIFAHEATNVVCQHGMGRMQKIADSVAREKQAAAYERIWKSTLPMRFKKVADRGAIMAMFRAGYFPQDYIEFIEAFGDKESADRVGFMKKDYVKMQEKGVVDTKKSRAARFADFKRMAGV